MQVLHAGSEEWAEYTQVNITKPDDAEGMPSERGQSSVCQWFSGFALGIEVSHPVGDNQIQVEVSWGHKDLPTLVYNVMHHRRYVDGEVMRA